jgi:hypothetical protein
MDDLITQYNDHFSCPLIEGYIHKDDCFDITAIVHNFIKDDLFNDVLNDKYKVSLQVDIAKMKCPSCKNNLFLKIKNKNDTPIQF